MSGMREAIRSIREGLAPVKEASAEQKIVKLLASSLSIDPGQLTVTAIKPRGVGVVGPTEKIKALVTGMKGRKEIEIITNKELRPGRQMLVFDVK